MQNIKNKLSCSAAAAACFLIAAFAEASAEPLPFGNFGLDQLSECVSKLQSDVKNETGFKPFFDYYAVLLTNPYGGAEQGTNYTHEMIYGITGDLEKVVGWKGATLVVSGAYNAGGNLSNTIGNFFTVSESSVVDGGMFFELYLAQKIDLANGDSATVRLGRIAMADSFNSLPIFGSLVSGAFDSTPASMFGNSPFTSSPVATWGASVKYETVENLSLCAGIYQIPQNVQSTTWSGTDWRIQSDDGYMAMFQIAWNPTFCAESDGSGGLSGTYQIGAWFFGGFDMPYLDGSTGSRGNGYGFYAHGQQQIWAERDNPNKYVSVFAGAQVAPVNSISTMPLMLYGGFQLQGFVPKRENDGLCVAFANGWFSYELNKVQEATYENMIEITYVMQLNENVSIQPDFQYIMRPYGNSGIDDALVVGGQLVVSF